MRAAFTTMLLIALALSWLWFWTSSSKPSGSALGSRVAATDTVVVWADDFLGSPDEAYYYSLADLWNTIEPSVHVEMSVMSHGGYDSKLRISMASAQPPDVCFSGLETLESLQYSGKASDLGVAIPEKYFSNERLKEMGSLVAHSIVRGDRPRVFPIWRYAYGGFLLANRTMLAQAGVNDEQIRDRGWTIDEFRAAAKAMTRDLDGDGKPDVWGFGAALAHLPHLFLNEFGPGVWGREITQNQFLAYDAAARRWTIDPKLTEQQIETVFQLFHQLLNVDKSWNPATLGMSFAEILDDVTMRRRLAMTFAETPLAPRMRADIWEANRALGVRQPPLSDLTIVWMPTLRAGDRPVPRAGTMGFSVFKQIPYKGDAHTDNAMRVAFFLTHPAHLARSQLRQFHHLPPDPKAFAEVYPELVHADDPWTRFYNEVMNSNTPVVAYVPSPDDPTAAQYAALSAKVGQWLNRDGINFLQQVIYQKLTPHEGATRFFHELKALSEARLDR